MNHHPHAIVLSLLAAFCLVFGLDASAKEQGEADEAIVMEDFVDADAATKRWFTVNDGVMGGKSKGGPSFADGRLTFAGSTNTDGGGFSSIRTRPGEHDLSEHAGLLIRVRGDGRTYKSSLRTDAKYGRWQIAFRADFETIDGEWIEVFVPFEDYVPSFRGREFRDPPPLELDKVQSMGLMIYDKQDGPFKLEVDWIKAVKQAPASGDDDN